MAILPGRLASRISLLALLAALAPSLVRAVPPGFSVTPVHTGLVAPNELDAFPVSFRFLPDGRLLYVELTGRVMVFDNDADPTPSVWATIPTNALGDRGLLGMALHPAFPDSPFVYFYGTHPTLVNRITRYRDQGGVGVDPVIVRDNIIGNTTQHHGGRLAFGPDGYLWLTYGDQSNSPAAQNANDTRGKLLRFTSMGQDAPGNPFGGGAAVVMGVRNSFGICFDPVTAEGYFSDNGDLCDDELNLIEVGANYGWGPSLGCGDSWPGVAPIVLFSQTIVPTSCVVYRGPAPGLDGNLFLGAYGDGNLRRVYLSGGGAVVDSVGIFHHIEAPILDVIIGNDGNLWFSTHDAIYRIDSPVVDVPTSTGTARRLRMAPNPFVGSVTLSLDGLGIADRIEVLDLGGRRVRRWTPSHASTQWDGKDDSGRDVPPGLYRIRAFAEGGVSEGRLVRIGRR
jgi:quinoprotein glucose dehydrogenase